MLMRSKNIPFAFNFVNYPFNKGIVNNFFSLLKFHILGYDGVWYGSFWSEGSENQLN